MKRAILFIENYVAGGADKVARLLIDHLSFQKVHVFVNASNDVSVLLKEPLPEHCELTTYKLATPYELGEFARSYKKNKLHYFVLRGFNACIRYPLILFSVLYFYLKFSKIDADVFISNNGGYPGGEYCRSATLAAYLLRNMKVFHIIHNIAVRPIPVYLPIEFLYDCLIDKCSVLICVSQATVKRLKKIRNIRQEIRCIHNGLRERSVKQYNQDATLRILNVGSLDRRKSQVLLLKALARLVRQGYRNFELYFVGKEVEKGYKLRLAGHIEDFSLEDRVYFEGFQEDPGKYYKNCDLFVLCSQMESLAIVSLEAMRVGMPVITTDVGDAHEQVVDGASGFVVRPGDDHMLAEKLQFFLDHPDMLEEMGRRGYQIFKEKFTLDKMMNEYTELFGLNDMGA